MRLINFLVLFAFASSALALQTVYTPSFRFYPVGFSLEAKLTEDYLLWDSRNENNIWKFGLLKFGASAATHGAVELSAAIYPISILQIYFGFGGTYRFYDSQSFDCTTLTCQGFLAKNKVGSRFILPFGEDNDFILIPDYSVTVVSHNVHTQPIVDETELLRLDRNGDILELTGIFLGRTFTKERTAGIYFRQGQYRTSGARNEMVLLLLRADWSISSFNFGVGRYQSSAFAPGFTIFTDYEWRSGKTDALF